ncbi:hypothetical protein [Actinokineospora inagensis]|uniref:hypothetical protein n=1 Tax=Actinokineospora inagensis TaxID=103730 RepID=UPI0012FC5C62|nr:hypothetical protein [Actinokineospora inagensis]
MEPDGTERSEASGFGQEIVKTSFAERTVLSTSGKSLEVRQTRQPATMIRGQLAIGNSRSVRESRFAPFPITGFPRSQPVRARGMFPANAPVELSSPERPPCCRARSARDRRG